MSLSLFVRRAFVATCSRNPIMQTTISSSARFFSKKPEAFMHVSDKKDPRFQEHLAEMENMENYWKQFRGAKEKQVAENARSRVDEIYEDLQKIEVKTTNEVKKDVQKVEEKVQHLRDLLFPQIT